MGTRSGRSFKNANAAAIQEMDSEDEAENAEFDRQNARNLCQKNG